uniref:Beta-1,4-N-acetylgalactosaminyltransferase n=1 Tax=Nothobranchius furzeri TaxID=105023 RepID=A0A8C6MK82_NOTFU
INHITWVLNPTCRQANLHVFEDWCGGSTADLRKNPHYPLYPHSRTMVQKLAVTPQWTNYGLRIFGYLHPFADGDFVFALSSDDNSEFWLSTNHSPLNLHLLVWVGKTGKEWTAPGEFEKYANQTSRPVRLSSQRRYYFEVIHKQNDRGTDHVEVAVSAPAFLFTIIESKHISLYVNESSLLMSDVDHIPQTAASHQRTSTKQHSSAADMLMEDPRDTLHKVRLINSELIRGVLPDCLYKPSYIIKDFPLMRYQGLQFVHMSYIYPNDYTRLTHMETENSCFYPEKQNNSSVVKAKQQPAVRSEKLIPKKKMVQMSHQLMNTQIQTIKQSPFQNKSRGSLPRTKTTAASQFVKKGAELNASITWRFTTPRRSSNRINKNSWSDRRREGSQREESENDNRADSRINANKVERFTLWDQQGDNTEGVEDEDLTPAPVFDTQVNWNQTFQVNQLDLHAKRSDWIDLNCNISGNLLLHPTDALLIVLFCLFILIFSGHPCRRFTLVRVVNVVKRVDGSQGSRYLLELELKDLNGQLLRLTQYVYALIRHGRPRSRNFGLHRSRPQLVLCNPVGFRWHPFATVHFIVPVKNQARWVLQLIADMEQLFKESGDSNFNLIITDYSSTDMDVKKALQKSSLPRYQYVKLSGNFERSAGLQAGVDLISDDHSIVFLCDLHIHFPPSIIDTIRKHCVEGYMAFAPIVLRLDCGMTPAEAVGFWEVNGFGLLGIYKSDLDAIGGMNTRDFRDRWGGEDWELIDRIMQGGLEVERIYLRNFYHYYHSKRGMWNRRMSCPL